MFLRVLLISGVFCYTRGIDSCESCDGVMHTMCEYPPGGGTSCREYRGGLTPEEERMVVELHNELRRRTATGETPAGDMREMSYDPGAVQVAQRWADQCEEMGHDRCRTVPGERHVGQNICLVSGYTMGTPPTREDALSTCLTSWFEEVENFRGAVDDFDPNPGELRKIGHYTQLVWASTDRLGCGMSQYTKGADYQYRLVCNYLPGGNVKHQSIYRVGPPCSQCPSGTSCSRRWPGLCVYNLPHTEAVQGDDPQPDLGCLQSPVNPTIVLLPLTIALKYHI